MWCLKKKETGWEYHPHQEKQYYDMKRHRLVCAESAGAQEKYWEELHLEQKRHGIF